MHGNEVQMKLKWLLTLVGFCILHGSLLQNLHPPPLPPPSTLTYPGSLIARALSALRVGSTHTIIMPFSSQLASCFCSLVARSHTAPECPCSCLVNTTSGSSPRGGMFRTSRLPSEVPRERNLFLFLMRIVLATLLRHHEIAGFCLILVS